MTRRREELQELLQRGAKLRFLSLPPRDVSSTAIRKALAAGEEPVGLSPQVMEYIRVMGLYGVPPCPQGAAQMYGRLRKTLTDKRLVWLIPELNNIVAGALHSQQPVALWNGNVIVAKTLPDLLRSIQETIVSTPPSTVTVQ